MEIAKNYDSSKTEEKWYAHWQAQNFFHSEPDEREAYTIVIPPPNVTGVLHMGHMLNNTIQDLLVRRARLLGKNACWVPGTDHASIATEAKVVQRLAKQGINKSDLTREEFMKHAWEWTDEYGGTILKQLKRLGASCDWERTRFTLEEDLSEAVIDVFIDLHEKGLIYRGARMVNWDPAAQTALSDEEVVHKEVNSKLYYLNYQIEGSEESLTIATTRPETILGDTAICVNPTDERYAHLKGKRAIVPLINRSIPIIQDEYVDVEFGTGCLKVTPAHDLNDYNLGIKHNLESIDILNDDGTLNENAQLYVGQDRFEVRKHIVKDLKAKGILAKEEDLQNKVGFSERTDAVIEPKLSIQWFCDMQKLAKPALDHVMDDTIQFYPKNTKNTYKHWMSNIKDWCISRQLWWGHRIPAFYFGQGPKDFVIAKTQEEALQKAKQASGNEQLTISDLRQDEDVLDTWFSSWLWPISVFDGFKNPDNPDINYYYPTNDLVTAPEIMFFWVARMVMAGYEYKGLPPFKNVYYTGIVRDKQRRKMSKSLGNSPDPIELIEKYGADGVRVGMLLSSPAGNDLMFDEGLCEQGRNFSNKIWNAIRLVKSWEISDEVELSEAAELGDAWFQSKFDAVLVEINDAYDKFRVSDVLMMTYKLVWDEFCSWYLEMVKPEYQQPIARKTYDQVIANFEKVLAVLHPFMPFITEEIYHLIETRNDEDCLMVGKWPVANTSNKMADEFEQTKEIITQIRNIRKSKNIAFKDAIELKVKSEATANQFDVIIQKLTNLSSIEYVNEQVENCISFVIGANEFYIPIGEQIDVEAEKIKIQTEIKYLEGFLKAVKGKLSNEKFVKGAPEQVVANEQKKLADAETKIELLNKQLAAL
ncbi:MAG: valine--tRNA ligase [Bacteroidetes bacterium]|nr:MAG: valine--tRNA ligase [Bacteroidota bacterium]MBL1145150.1 valine--tRNA ligase [Bacteroidota bacterium]NOG57946.1 valine--tRNA ligase [Bacteroidota bacterium]